MAVMCEGIDRNYEKYFVNCSLVAAFFDRNFQNLFKDFYLLKINCLWREFVTEFIEMWYTCFVFVM